MKPRDRAAWIRDEPRLADMLRHVVRRALRRPLIVAAVTLGLAGVLLVQRLRKPPSYTATVTMRITEGLRSEAAPTPPAQVKDYLWSVALSRSRLAKIMRKYGIDGPNPTARQVDQFRERIDMGISNNTFSADNEWIAEGGPRSVLVTFEFSAGDEDTAGGVLHDLTDAVVETTRAMRAERLDMQRQALQAAQEQARARVREIDDEMGRLAGGGAGAPDLAQRQAQLLDLYTVKENFVRRMSGLAALAAASDLAEGAEKTGLGMQFDVVDEDVEGYGLPMGKRGIAMTLAIVLLVVGPICLIVVGAFDRRVYGRDDLVQAGVAVLGVLPRFRGDAVGSFADRIRRRRRKRI